MKNLRFDSLADLDIFKTAQKWRQGGVPQFGPPSTTPSSSPAPAPRQISPRKDSRTPTEAAVLAACIKALALHPAVAWAHRMNTGALTSGDRYVRFGFKGCSDIIGQLMDGRFLAIEVKRPGGIVTEDQLAFLARVQDNHGLAFVAWSVDDIGRGLMER